MCVSWCETNTPDRTNICSQCQRRLSSSAAAASSKHFPDSLCGIRDTVPGLPVPTDPHVINICNLCYVKPHLTEEQRNSWCHISTDLLCWLINDRKSCNDFQPRETTLYKERITSECVCRTRSSVIVHFLWSNCVCVCVWWCVCVCDRAVCVCVCDEVCVSSVKVWLFCADWFSLAVVRLHLAHIQSHTCFCICTCEFSRQMRRGSAMLCVCTTLQ